MEVQCWCMKPTTWYVDVSENGGERILKDWHFKGNIVINNDNLLLNHPEYVASKRFADSSRVGWYHIYGPKIDEFKTWIPIAIWRETSPQCSTFRQRHVRHTNHQKNSPFVSATEVAARQCCHGAAAGDGAGEGHSVAVGAASPAGGKPRRPGEMEPTRLGNLRPKTGKRWNMRSKSLAKWRFDHLKFGDSSNQQQVWFTIWFEILKHQECGFEPNGIWASCWKTLQVWIGRARCGLDDTWIVTESGSIS